MVCGGGTAGHVYPSLAVIEALIAMGQEPSDIVYLGTAGSVEEQLAGRSDIPFSAVDSGKFRGRAPWDIAISIVKTARGTSQSSRVIAQRRPEVLFSTGGYASVPPLLSARKAGVPAMIYLPDIEPGMAIKWMSRLVDRVGVSFEDTLRYFPKGKAVVTGYPVRGLLLKGDKNASRRRLGLREDRLVFLAFGGSQGARSINRAVVSYLSALLNMAQVVHITGSLDHDWVSEARAALSAGQQSSYFVFDYLHEEMADVLIAADVALARAGASTLAEFPAVGLPSLLVPYPHSGGHQMANARFMERYGAGAVILDAELSTRLLTEAQRILNNDVLRAQMAERARSLARPQAAQRLAQELSRLSAGNVEKV